VIAPLLALVLALNPACWAKTPQGVPIGGVASWYDATSNNAWYTRGGNRMYAAVGSFRWGNTPYRLKVCRADNLKRCVTVTVSDYCQRCAQDLKRTWTGVSRNIDLSPQAFAKLQGLQLGVVRVIILDWDGIRP
jgi:rare lipoprotein A (peptidoglycan hydrolase)